MAGAPMVLIFIKYVLEKYNVLHLKIIVCINKGTGFFILIIPGLPVAATNTGLLIPQKKQFERSHLTNC